MNRSGPTRASGETGTDSVWSPTDLRAFFDATGDRRLLASFVVDGATGLTTINVTADQITVRQAKTDLLAWAPPPSWEAARFTTRPTQRSAATSLAIRHSAPAVATGSHI